MIKWERMRWAGHVARTGETSAEYRVLVRKFELNRHLENLGVDGDDIKMYLKEMVWEDVGGLI